MPIVARRMSTVAHYEELRRPHRAVADEEPSNAPLPSRLSHRSRRASARQFTCTRRHNRRRTAQRRTGNQAVLGLQRPHAAGLLAGELRVGLPHKMKMQQRWQLLWNGAPCVGRKLSWGSVAFSRSPVRKVVSSPSHSAVYCCGRGRQALVAPGSRCWCYCQRRAS